MPNITIEQVSGELNEFVAAQTAKINSLETNSAAALTALSELANREYGFSHPAVVNTTLDEDYTAILTAHPELANVSALGFTAILHDTDFIENFVEFVRVGQQIVEYQNYMYINGIEEPDSYVFAGDNSENGIELVNVWLFEKNEFFVSPYKAPSFVVDVRIHNKNVAITNLPENFYKFTTVAEFYNFTPTVNFYGRKLIVNGFINLKTPVKASDRLEELYSSCKAFPANVSGLSNNTNLRKIELPECLVFGGMEYSSTNEYTYTNSTMLMGCSNLELEIIFPKVISIFGSRNASGNLRNPIFHQVHSITIPASVKKIRDKICGNNNKVKLNCANADFIDPNWCYSAPEIFEMCEDWAATINISVAATNWVKSDYIDLFNNKLKNVGANTKTLTISATAYAELTAEEIAVAEGKGWVITPPLTLTAEV